MAALLFWLGVREGVAQVAAELKLPKHAVVPLRLLEQVSTADARDGEVLHLEVLRDVSAQRHLLVRRGAPASGQVDFVAKSWKGVQGGQLRIVLKQVELADGEFLPLDSAYGSFGGGVDRTATNKPTTGDALRSGLNPLDPVGTALWFLAGGQEVVLPKGTRLDGYVADETALDPAKFAVAEVAWTTETGDPLPPPDQPRKEELKVSTADGDGSLYVDGSFRAEAPATLTMDRGIHLLTVLKDGYKVWKERVVVDGDGLEVVVSLVKK